MKKGDGKEVVVGTWVHRQHGGGIHVYGSYRDGPYACMDELGIWTIQVFGIL